MHVTVVLLIVIQKLRLDHSADTLDQLPNAFLLNFPGSLPSGQSARLPSNNNT
jgi:hypothetical protein